MKVLLDACVWGPVGDALRNEGHDAVWVGEWESDPGDEEILDICHREDRVLITLDKDFGEPAVLRGRPHCGIVRLVDFSAVHQARACIQVLERYGSELVKGALVTAEPTRTRIRTPVVEIH